MYFYELNFLIKFYMRQHDFYMNDTLFKLSNVSILLQFYYKMYIITKWTLILKIKLALVVYYFLQIKIDFSKATFLFANTWEATQQSFTLLHKLQQGPGFFSF